MIPLMCEEKNNSDALFSHAVEVARKHGLISKGDIVVITAGIPLGISGTTNMLKVERIKVNVFAFFSCVYKNKLYRKY